MPHIKLEYSTNVVDEPDANELFSRVHKLLAELGPIDIASIRSRLIPRSEFFVADGKSNQAFVHLELAILPGRHADLKKKVSTALLAEIKNAFSTTAKEMICSFSVEVRELDGDSYSKELTGKA